MRSFSDQSASPIPYPCFGHHAGQSMAAGSFLLQASSIFVNLSNRFQRLNELNATRLIPESRLNATYVRVKTRARSPIMRHWAGKECFRSRVVSTPRKLVGSDFRNFQVYTVPNRASMALDPGRDLMMCNSLILDTRILTSRCRALRLSDSPLFCSCKTFHKLDCPSLPFTQLDTACNTFTAHAYIFQPPSWLPSKKHLN